jgi:hypothetical protein
MDEICRSCQCRKATKQLDLKTSNRQHFSFCDECFKLYENATVVPRPQIRLSKKTIMESPIDFLSLNTRL